MTDQPSNPINSEQQAPIPEPPRTPGKKLVIMGVVVALILSAITFYFRVTIGGDRQSHYMRATLGLVNDYLDYSHEVWPKSWEELEKMPKQDAWYEPLNFDEVKKNVIIDFEATDQEIAQQTPENFHVIRPVRPIFRFDHDPRLLRLIARFRMKTQPH